MTVTPEEVSVDSCSIGIGEYVFIVSTNTEGFQ